MYAGSILDSSANNIPTSFDTTAGSKIIASCPSGGMLGFISTVAAVIAFEVGSYPGVAVPSSTLPGRSGFIPSSGTGTIDWFKVNQGDSVFIRSTTGSALSTGKVYFFIK